MDAIQQQLESSVFNRLGLKISRLTIDPESKAYAACSFLLNGKKILSRTAKITPKKTGQFVTFWKRNAKGIIEPFHENDQIDFFTVNVCTENQCGQFVFPKSVLVKKGIISTENKEGKRAFRVYPSWSLVENKQAIRSQQWQLDYFYLINDSTPTALVLALYETC